MSDVRCASSASSALALASSLRKSCEIVCELHGEIAFDLFIIFIIKYNERHGAWGNDVVS